jgi:hypothetical protein
MGAPFAAASFERALAARFTLFSITALPVPSMSKSRRRLNQC